MAGVSKARLGRGKYNTEGSKQKTSRALPLRKESGCLVRDRTDSRRALQALFPTRGDGPPDPMQEAFADPGLGDCPVRK